MEIQAASSVNPAYLATQQQAAQIQQPEPAADSQQSAAAGAVSQPADQVRFSSSVTVKNLDTVKAIEQMHARMNELVKGTRETNESLNKAAEQVNFMQSNLSGILKNFPPFPMDSKERQDLLMSYTSIRQELMRMTVPQPPPPLYEQVRQDWNKTVGQNGQMLASAVPALDTGSSDTQVKQASLQLDNTSTSLADLSSGVTQALVGG